MIELPAKLAVMMLIAALCLGATNMVTAAPIQQQQEMQAESLRREVLPDASSFTPIEIEGAPAALLAAYEAPEGYVFEMNASGFGGAMGVTVGINQEGILQGMRIGTHSETPGLGTKAAEEPFFGQYAGKAAQPLTVTKSTPGDGEIQAITAATVTSTAVTNAVNDAIACYALLKGGAQ
jgi:electron transport complex protein RnfG